MTNIYHSLTFNKINKTTGIYQSTQMKESSVQLSDPAIVVMTDFKRISAIQVESTASIDNANKKMIICGVRLLFVADENNVIIGLITANDILGEKPVNYIREHGGHRDEIMVRDIMVRNEDLDSVQIEAVARGNVGDIVETLKACDRHHVLVTESTESGMCVRGLFSRTQVSRQLGEAIKFNNRANTFAELEYALVAGA
jgi:CBS-domain-containing membrane protein